MQNQLRAPIDTVLRSPHMPDIIALSPLAGPLVDFLMRRLGLKLGG